MYIEKPFVLLNRDRVVLSSGTLSEINALIESTGDYYKDCTVEARKHDLYLNDNRKLRNVTEEK